MNESTLTQLKILVERAVRPLQASISRKRRIRQELLNHLTLALDEELARPGGERAALEQIAARFGNPAELTEQLQDSVPAGDRFKAFADRLWFRPGESWWRRAIRQALLIEMVIPAILLPSWLAAGAPVNKLIDSFRLAGSQLFALFLAAFIFPFLAEWMTWVLYRPKGRSWLGVLLVCAAGSLMFSGFSFWLDFADRGLSSVNWTDALLAAGVGMLCMPGGLAIMARVANEWIRYQQEWASLQIA